MVFSEGNSAKGQKSGPNESSSNKGMGSSSSKGGNPWHDPTNGRFTSGPQNGDGDKSTDLAAIAAAEYAQQHALEKSEGKCYTYVKRALLAAGVASHYLTGAAAKDAGQELEGLGYRNDLKSGDFKSPYDAPVGSIIVYAPTADAHDPGAKYGHIEFRTHGGFASDYYSHNARTGPASNGMTGRGRTVIGIYVRH